jgi:ribonuclease HII
VDEAGRGPLAGPVVAAAVVLPATGVPEGIDDSKRLAANTRARLAAQIRSAVGVQVGIGVVEPDDIDRLDILRATHVAMRLALLALDPLPDLALVDGLPVPGLPVRSMAIVRGDARSVSVAAASIVAKVYRDDVVATLDRLYPGYGFSRHKGYGTAQHLAALRRLGPCPAHRRSFAPVARCIVGSAVGRQPELPL